MISLAALQIKKSYHRKTFPWKHEKLVAIQII